MTISFLVTDLLGSVTLFRGSTYHQWWPHESTCSVYNCRSVPGWSGLSDPALSGELPLKYPEVRPWLVNSSFDRSTSGRSCGTPEEFSEWWIGPCNTGRSARADLRCHALPVQIYEQIMKYQTDSPHKLKFFNMLRKLYSYSFLKIWHTRSVVLAMMFEYYKYQLTHIWVGWETVIASWCTLCSAKVKFEGLVNNFSKRSHVIFQPLGSYI